MCHQDAGLGGDNNDSSTKPSDSFPWHIGAYDAHCHPTDTMASIASLTSMRTSILTVMATRSQDQDLVAEVAVSHGLDSAMTALPSDASSGGACKIIPAFGWHPWFSHQLYDDSVPEPTYSPESAENAKDEETEEAKDERSRSLLAAAKAVHYRAVLQPPPENEAFIESLPDPAPLSLFLAATRKRLAAHPLALIGEMGLDKAFRLPQQWAAAAVAVFEDNDAAVHGETPTPGGREGRMLSAYRVRMPHQQAILTAQLKLAGELGRGVSLHGVQAHGVLYDTVSRCWAGHELHVPSRREKNMVAAGAEDFSSSSSGSDEDDDNELGQRMKQLKLRRKEQRSRTGIKPFPPRICLHSFSGSASTLEQWMKKNVPSKVYVSFSTAVNMSTEAVRSKIDDVIRAVPDDRILIESDLHKAGDTMEGLLEDMYRHVCQVKGWELQEGVFRIRNNYQTFIFG